MLPGQKGTDVDFTFRHKPYQHQLDEFLAHREHKAWALLWEQGTGKTKAVIDLASYLFARGLIDTVLIVGPSGPHLNWEATELPEHTPSELEKQFRVHTYRSVKAGTVAHKEALDRLLTWKGLSWLVMSYDAFITKKGKNTAWRFLEKRRCLYVLDESRHIKGPGAKRTKAIVASGRYAAFRRILNGTPIANGPFDAYSQIKFLDEDFWKRYELDSFTVFKQHFGVWDKGYNRATEKEYPVLRSYRRLDELHDILKGISTRVLKADCLDLPQKIYSKRYYELTPEQQRVYEELRKDYVAWHGDQKQCPTCLGNGQIEINKDDMKGWYSCPECEGAGTVKGRKTSAPLAIVRLLRFQQVLCGYLPTDDDKTLRLIEGGNPRLDDLMDNVEGAGETKGIIWARFRMDMELISAGLKERGLRFVRYDGSVGDKDRVAAVERFQKQGVHEGGPQWFLGNPQAAGEGITLTAAKIVDYYNNSFKLTERLQSEDRAHRIGQTSNVSYYDRIAQGTVDEHIVKALRDKMDIASTITGDRLKGWL
jgi:SNF2 family DNA or RNA helicase